MNLKTLATLVALCGLPLGAAFASEGPTPTPNVYKVVPELRLKDGQVFHNVKFVDFASTSVLAKWDGGMGTIAYGNLPDDYRIAMKSYMPQPAPDPTPIPTLEPLEDVNIPADPMPPSGKETKIAGQCFIVTKGGQNIKLGLVEIGVYAGVSWNHYFDAIEKIAEDRRQKLRAIYKATVAAEDAALNALQLRYNSDTLDAESKARRAMNETTDASSLLEYDKWSLLPPPVYSTKTDADGRFSLTHNVATPYVVFARAKRLVGKETELYGWIVLSSSISDPNNIFLSNDNLAVDTSVGDTD